MKRVEKKENVLHEEECRIVNGRVAYTDKITATIPLSALGAYGERVFKEWNIEGWLNAFVNLDDGYIDLVYKVDH